MNFKDITYGNKMLVCIDATARYDKDFVDEDVAEVLETNIKKVFEYFGFQDIDIKIY